MDGRNRTLRPTMAMATIGNTDRQTFLANLLQSGLLSSEELEALLPRLPESDRGKIIARVLVEQGTITKFQAEMVLAGRTSGFHLGQYRVLDQLGRGGMGRVFKAEHRAMHRQVALKIMASNLVKTERSRQLFEREVRAAARLIHPNIVTAYDANQFGDRHYLVMEYVNGPSLEELVQERGPLPVQLACDFIRQAAEGLNYAAENGMVHRDIKPANLLLQLPAASNATGSSARLAARWVVKILDFGLARLHAAQSEGQPGFDSIDANVNTVMGTPDFVSPEQTRDLHRVDIRADLYSLGCTMYYVLTGKVPFPGGSPMDKMLRHNSEEPVPIESLRMDIPPAVADIVRRLMAKDPAARFQKPAELIEALAEFASPASGLMSNTALSGVGLKSRAAVAADALDFDEESALLVTLPNNLDETPRSLPEMVSMQIRHRPVQVQHSQLKIVAVVACVILTLVGVAGALAWWVIP